MLRKINFVEGDINNFIDDLILSFKKIIDSQRFCEDEFPNGIREILNSRSKFRTDFQTISTKILELENNKQQEIYDTITNNNEIELICRNPTTNIEYYKEEWNELGLDIFFKSLWENTKDLVSFKENYGDLQVHYKKFIEINNQNQLCPFCGLERLTSPKIKRNAYDHYLCKKLFPFSSLNFKNLIPMCNSCNGSPCKGEKNILLNNDSRIKIYYPYSEPISGFNISIEGDYFSEELSLNISPKNNNENVEFNQWKNIFLIEDRYNDFLEELKDSWRDNVFDLIKKDNINSIGTLKTKLDYLKISCDLETGNFIKIAFYDFIQQDEQILRSLLDFYNEREKYEN